MGLFDLFKKSPVPCDMPIIGVSEAVCPYCSRLLQRKPAKKTKCPQCGKFIYVRTRPQDQLKVLATEQQADLIEEQWSIVNGAHGEYLAQKNKIEVERARLAKQFGKAPSENDIKWGLLGKDAIEHALNGNWGLYRNARFQMAEVLRKESKLKQALSMYCWVCYLDLNGPRNTSGVKDQELLREFPPFSPKEAFLAPGIISRMARIIEKLNLDQEKVSLIFQEITVRVYKGLKLPMQPEDAWKSVRRELFG
jgi:predicted RNA-binding Zn-ribbon protein involved in translation (DUF1610 family)